MSRCLDLRTFVLGALAVITSAAPARPNFRVNSYTSGTQADAAIAADASGAFVVVWMGAVEGLPSLHILGRRYDAAGDPLGPDFRVSSAPAGGNYPTVALVPGGGFAVAWSNPDGVFARLFDGTGTPLAPEFRVNEDVDFPDRARVAADGAGNFTVVWEGYPYFGYTGSDVYLRRYDAGGVPLGPQAIVNTYTYGTQRRPSVAASAAGDFVVVWQDRHQDGSDYGIRGRRFDGLGNPLGDEFAINTQTTGTQWRASVAADAVGGFVVTWESPDGDVPGIVLRRYDATGAPLGSEVLANEWTSGAQVTPVVAVGPGGDFMVAWTSTLGPFGDTFLVGARRFDASGAPAGPDFRVNSHDESFQGVSAIAAGGDGRFIVAWNSGVQDGDSWGVYADRLGDDPIFADGFESGNASAWSAAATDAGDLDVTAAAALADTTAGLEGAVNDTAGLYVEDSSPNGETRYRARFYLDPNGFDPGESGGTFRTRVFIGFADHPMRRVMAVVLKRRDGVYALQARVRQDDGSQVDTPFHTISDAPHWVEVDWRRATEPGASDGWFRLWIDGAVAGTSPRLSNGTAQIDFVRLGALSVKSTAAGTLRWDEFVSRRLTYIGPVVP
jgi:hypothetical protein